MRAATRPRRAARRRGLYAGWRVVAGAFLTVLVGFGAIYSYAAFAEEIALAFGADQVSIAMVFALSGGTCFLVSAVSGPLADRLGPRIPALAGMLLVGLGLVVAATARSLVEIYAGYGLLIGLGTGFAYVPAMAAVQRWFTRHRGLASGIAASGIGVGTALVPPAAEAVVALGDWRTAFIAFGLAAAVVGAGGALLLEPGGRRGPSMVPPPPPTAAVLPGILRRPAFAGAWVGTLLVSVPATLPHAMLVGTARDLGIGRGDALALLGLIGLGTIAGRFLIAALADVVGRRATFLACCAGMAGSMVVWALAEGEVALQAFALGFGALQGGFVALLPAFGADSFGARSVGTVIGALYTSRGVALLLAPPALSAAAAAAGHDAPLLVVAGLGLVGALLLARTPRRLEPCRDDPARRAVRPRVLGGGVLGRAAVVGLAALTLSVWSGHARAQDAFAGNALVWVTPAAVPGVPRACARMLVLDLPRDWMAGDAAAVVLSAPGSDTVEVRRMADRLRAILLDQETAVLSYESGRGGGEGACAQAPLDATAEVLGALEALGREVAAGTVVAFGLGAAGPAVLEATRDEVAARMLGAGGPRLAAGAALGGSGPVAFRAGAPPPAAERWPERAPHLCAALAPVAGPEGVAACVAALRPERPGEERIARQDR